MSEPTKQQIKSSRIKLLALIAIAMVPIFLSILLFQYLPQLQPAGTTNQGELVLPPVDVKEVSPDLLSYENWVLLQTAGESCNADCKQMLYFSRQVITGLGKDSGRVERVIVAPTGVDEKFRQHLSEEHVDVAVMSINQGALDKISDDVPLLFLIDPNGNIMMFYSVEKAGKPMLKDLKHLLKISNIG